MKKVNFGCFNSNIDGWIGVDYALRHIIISRIPFVSWLLWKSKLLNDEQYNWHKNGLFRSVRYGNITKRLKFRSSSIDFVYSSHTLEHLWRDDAVFFLNECFRILKEGGILRICFPGWEDLRIQETFENSLFAKNKKELKLSHKWLWSYEDIKNVLEKIGFCSISRHNFKEGIFPDIDKIEHRTGLIFQAQK